MKRPTHGTAARLLSLVFIALMGSTGLFSALLPLPSFADRTLLSSGNDALQGLKLTQSIMCEQVVNGVPIDQSVIFPISNEQVNCFTAFDPVPEDTVIYHNWYRKDKLSTKRKLSLKPPRWKTFSSIHLRESDIGPWRVEVVGPGGEMLDIMRFSVTE